MDKQEFISWAKSLQDSYVANQVVKQKLKGISIIAIVGPTGVGKSTIINKLGYPDVKSDVTRVMRPDEKKDVNYHFRNDYENMMKQIKAGEYVQYLISDTGEFYGTKLEAYPESGLCSMAIYASAIQSFRQLGFRKIIPIYIMPPGYVEWMRRMGSMRSQDLSFRMKEAITSIKLALKDNSYHFVLNDNLELALNDIHSIINNEEPDEHRAGLARDTADILLERLGDQDDDIYFNQSDNQQ